MTNMMNILRKRLRDDEHGFTLLEMVVAVMIFGLLTVMIFNLFKTSNDTTQNVQAGSTSIAEAQTATSQLAKKIRNASKVKVSTDGSRLDIENPDGSCTAWVYTNGALYYDNEGQGADFSSDWFVKIHDVSLTDNNRFFTKLNNGVSYAFDSGSGVGVKRMQADNFMRLPSTVQESVCFGDSPNPTPSPTPTPTTPPVVVYTITYDLAGGTSLTNPSHYSQTTSEFTINNPTRSGYTFAGWTGTGIIGAPVTTLTIPTGSTGDRVYVANWTIIPPAPTPTPTPTPPASGVNMQGTFVLENSWGSGANARIDLKATANQPNNWKLTFTLPAGSSISWNNFQSCVNVGNTYTCTVPDWAVPTNSGATGSVGFGINGSAPSTLTVTFSKR